MADLLIDVLPKRHCEFSPCEKWRYVWSEIWDESLPPQIFAGLNPSTADWKKTDPTVRRWLGFAKDWGRGGIIVLNAFAWRDTDWTALKRVPDPVGPENDLWIARTLATAGVLPIACWGGNASKVGNGSRGEYLRDKFRWDCLGTNGDGSPCHPLYLPAARRPRPWNYEVGK